MHALYDDGENEILTECGEALPILAHYLLPMNPGAVIWNGYQLDRTIGRGEFAKVKLAYCLQTKAPVAIKFLRTTTTKAKSSVEAKLILQLLHPHIVPVLDVQASEEGMAIVMHYCRNGELFDLVERLNGLDESIARQYFVQLLSAVDYLHNTMDIVHRDIKLVRSIRTK